MANGTIAFDTLTTSDSVNTGTEKSIDTSYLLNGSAKAFNDTNSAGTSINNSFNISSLEDTGSGRQRHTFTNNMASANYSGVFEPTDVTNAAHRWVSKANTHCDTSIYNGSSYVDGALGMHTVGDLA